MYERIMGEDREEGVDRSESTIRLFESLVRRHSAEIRAYLAKLAGHVEDAEELAQDVFVKAFRKLDTLRDPGAARRWLFTIAVNHFNDWIESRARPRRGETFDIEQAPTPSHAEPHNEVFADELGELIAEETATLPERQRTVLLLYAARGFDYSDIAKALDISVDAVKMSLFHAREKLRRRVRGVLRNG